MIKNNRNTYIPELKEKGTELQSVAINQREYKFDTTPIIIPIRLDGVSSCAFNPQNTLFLVYGFIIGLIQPDPHFRQIYTTEGYYVTDLLVDNNNISPWSNMLKFCDHFILRYGFNKYSFGNQSSSSFVNFRITRHNEDNTKSVQSISLSKTIENSFLDCDNSGNVYIIDENSDMISVYDSDLEFAEDLDLDRREKGVIVAINIHDDYLILLEFIIGGRVINKFCISTREHVESVQVDSYQLSNPNRIISDKHNNILIYSASAFNPLKNYSNSISVLYDRGKIEYYTLPELNENGNKSDKDSHLEFAITDNYQLISVMLPGYILIYNLT